MKKIASILLLVLTFAIDVHAELEEVRGILTKQEVSEDGLYCFIFINENDYPVWLDMEVYCDATYHHESQRYTKSITLQAGETYEWFPKVQRYTIGGPYLKDFHTKYKAYKKQ